MRKPSGECVGLASTLSLLSVAITSGHILLLLVLWKDPFKRFRTPATLFVAGMALANFLSGFAAGPLLVIRFIGRDTTDRDLDTLTAIAYGFLYWTTNVSYLTMLGMSLCQYIAVSLPHKQQALVTRKTVLLTLVTMTVLSLLTPLLLALRVPSLIIDKLQLHFVFQLTTFLLCAVYFALGRAYVRQVKRATDTVNQSTVTGGSCVRVRDRNFTRANLLLLASVTLLSVPIMISWNFSIYGHSYLETAKITTIIIFFFKIALDPLIYCWRLPLYRRALNRIFDFRQRQNRNER